MKARYSILGLILCAAIIKAEARPTELPRGFQLPDSMCLTYGQMGGHTAEAMSHGVTAEYMRERYNKPTKGQSDAMWSKNNLKIVDYLDIMKYDADMAKKMIYLKCKAGEYNP